LDDFVLLTEAKRYEAIALAAYCTRNLTEGMREALSGIYFAIL
jgi:hypothetical protein